MDWVTGILVGLVAAVLNYGASFVWVFIYGAAIEPGHDEAYYQAYAQQPPRCPAFSSGLSFSSSRASSLRGDARSAAPSASQL